MKTYLSAAVLIVMAFSSLITNAQSTEKQVRDSIAIISDDNVKFKLLIRLCKMIRKRSIDSAFLLADEALAIAKKGNNDKTLARAYRLISNLNYEKGNYLNAIENSKVSIKYSSNAKDSSSLSSEFDEMGRAFRRIGDYKKALGSFYKGIAIATAKEDKEMIGGLDNNIAMVLSDNGDDSLALKYYSASLEISKELKDTLSIILSLCNIGYQYSVNGRRNEEEHCYFQALELMEKAKNEEKIGGLVYDNIASLWEKKDDNQKALMYFLKALECERKYGSKVYVIEELFSLTDFYISIKEFQPALTYANEALALSEDVNSIDLKQKISKDLSIIHENLNNFKESLRFSRIAEHLKDSLHSISKQQEISNVATRFELNKKEEQEKFEEQRKLLAQNRHNSLEYLMMGLVVIAIFISIFAIRGRIKEKRLDYLTFIAFLLLFEFLITLFEPRIQNLTQNEPFLILLGNALLAGIIAPLHSLVERKFKAILIVRKESLIA